MGGRAIIATLSVTGAHIGGNRRIGQRVRAPAARHRSRVDPHRVTTNVVHKYGRAAVIPTNRTDLPPEDLRHFHALRRAARKVFDAYKLVHAQELRLFPGFGYR